MLGCGARRLPGEQQESAMATDLDTLITAEKVQQDALGKDISKGTSAQVALAQVKAVLADLTAAQQRRKSILDGANARLAAAHATASQVTAGLATVDAFLTTLPGTLKITDLDKASAEKLLAPLDPTKTYDDYATAAASTSAAAAKAVLDLADARATEAQARASVDRAEVALQAAVDATVATADAAKAALADAARAVSGADIAGAYWFDQRAKALVAAVTDTAVTAAESALRLAIDGVADATDLRLQAELSLVHAQADRSKSSDELAVAAGQVLKKLGDTVKAKAGP